MSVQVSRSVCRTAYSGSRGRGIMGSSPEVSKSNWTRTVREKSFQQYREEAAKLTLDVAEQTVKSECMNVHVSKMDGVHGTYQTPAMCYTRQTPSVSTPYICTGGTEYIQTGGPGRMRHETKPSEHHT